MPARGSGGPFAFGEPAFKRLTWARGRRSPTAATDRGIDELAAIRRSRNEGIREAAADDDDSPGAIRRVTPWRASE
jgi:hypothetical protein